MTNERDFDLLARTWLDLGPNETPDRVIAAVLQAAETTSQVRRPFLAPLRRSFSMNRLPIAAVAAVTLAVVVGGSLLVLRNGDAQGVGAPTVPATIAPTSAAVSPSPSAPAAVPAALHGIWMGGHRDLLGISEAAGTALIVSPTGLAITQSASADQPALSAKVAASGPDTIIVTKGDGDGSDCDADATGEYAWALSEDGRRLTVTAVADPCAARLAAVPGEWLLRGCKDPEDNCLGDLTAGTYRSQFITPRLDAEASWAPDYGALTYTVPEGWANSADFPDHFVLVPSTEYAAYGPTGGPDGVFHEIGVKARPALNEQTPDCKGKEIATIDRTVAGLVDGIRKQPSLVASDPTDITVGGHPATYVDIRIAPDWTATCPDIKDGTPAAVFLTVLGGTGTDEGIGLAGDEQVRLVLVDIGQGDLVAVWVDSTDPARFDQLVADAMPIIESMTFE